MWGGGGGGAGGGGGLLILDRGDIYRSIWAKQQERGISQEIFFKSIDALRGHLLYLF